MRRIVPWKATALSAVMLLLLAACGSTEPAETTNGETPATTSGPTATTSGSTGTTATGSSETTAPTESYEPAEVTMVIASAVLAPKEEVATFSVAQQLGYFEEENLTVDLQNADGSTAAIQAVATGSADITAADLGSLFAAVSNDVPVVGLGGLVVNWPWRIAVPSGSDVASCEDLAGKRIGIISLASGSNPFARSFVEACDLDPDADVQLLPVGVGAQATAALESGEVDSLALYTQAYTTLEQAGLELTYLDNPDTFEGLTSLTWTVSRDTLENEPEKIERFMRAAYKALAYSLANTEAAMEMGYEAIPQMLSDSTAEERLEGDTALLATWLETAAPAGPMEDWTEFGRLSPEALATTMDFAVKAGTVDEAFDPSEAYTNELLDSVNAFDVASIIQQATN